MIEIEHLSKRFGALKAVDDLSFHVVRGDVLGFLGPNGAGKSTTMKMITGFITPDAGRIVVGGDDIAENPIAVKRRIGYLPEGAPLYGDMTVRGFLEFIGQVRGYRGAERSSRLDRVIDQVSLDSVLEMPIDTLSKGFKRRVGLAQAILHDPQVMILDEPTDGLDPNQKHEVRTLIRDMSEEKVIVLSTHILEEVEAVCNRAIVIAAGRIVLDGTPGELLARSELHNAVSLTLRGAASNGVREVLARLPGVGAVHVLDEDDAVARFKVISVDGAPLVAAVSQVVREQGWDVEEIYVERGRLDDVFRQVTAGAAR